MTNPFRITNDPHVQQAIDLLTENDFEKNVRWVLNTPVLQPKIKFTGHKGVTPALKTSLGINVIDDQRNIGYNGKLLQFVVCDMLSSKSFKKIPVDDARVLYVIHEEGLVLETLVRQSVRDGMREYFFPGFFDDTLPRFKNGSWLSMLPKLVEHLKSKQHQI
jgi:hypothetical protein